MSIHPASFNFAIKMQEKSLTTESTSVDNPEMFCSTIYANMICKNAQRTVPNWISPNEEGDENTN
jgi:hypothetical protein